MKLSRDFLISLSLGLSCVQIVSSSALPHNGRLYSLKFKRDPIKCDQGMIDNGSGVCVDCQPGTYGPDGYSCRACEGGTFADESGTVVCKDCPIGTYSKFDAGVGGIKECLPCSGSREYQDERAQGSCKTCSQFRSPNSAHTDCVCQDGLEPASDGVHCIIHCRPGYYTPDDNDSCIACDKGYFSDKTDATQCTECAKGTYSDGIGSAVCKACQGQDYQPMGGQQACLNCDSSMMPSTDHSACLCRPGSLPDPADLANKCIPIPKPDCPAGRYRDNQGDCHDCPIGMISTQINSQQCTACTDDYYQDTEGQRECKLCQPPFVTQDNKSCGYPPGFPLQPDMEHCGSVPGPQCLAGSFIDQSNGGECKPCPAGTYSNTDFAFECQTCFPPLYQPGQGKSSCLTCENGVTSPDHTSCTPSSGGGGGITCQPGQQPNATGKKCVPCPTGKVNPTGQGACVACDAGKTPNSLQTACVGCDAGSIVKSGGCLQCDAGKYTSDGLTCKACPAGTFSARGSTECQNCPEGSISGASAVSCSQCPESAPFVKGNNLCAGCDAGTYWSAADKRCIACAANQGKYQDLPNQTSCKSCTGTVPSGAKSCVTCPFKQSGTKCVSCSPGTYWNSGTSACVQCAANTFQDQENQESCKACPDNTFATGKGNTECSSCSGSTPFLNSNKKCVSCSAGTYWSQDDLRCVSCPVSTYQDEANQMQCKSDSACTKKINKTGAKSCPA